MLGVYVLLPLVILVSSDPTPSCPSLLQASQRSLPNVAEVTEESFGESLVATSMGTAGSTGFGYEKVDKKGYCYQGYYAGWESNNNKDSLDNCKRACDAETRCKYFAYEPGRTCSRYDTTSCTIYANSASTTYKKLTSAVCPTSMETTGVLGDYACVVNGRCEKGYYAGWEANSNKDSLENCMKACSREERCKFIGFYPGKSCSRYDTDVCETNNDQYHITYSKKPDRYTWWGTGYCNQGYYAGWESNHYKDSLENCKQACAMETRCKYISYQPGRTCSRYDATSCATHVDSASTSYKKLYDLHPLWTGWYEYVMNGRCEKGYYAGWEANSNKDSLENCMKACSWEDKCKFISFYPGKSCSRYDTDVCETNKDQYHISYRKTKREKYMFGGVGYCNQGYYAGWEDNDYKYDLENCKYACDIEPQCKYFSYEPGRTCSRYNADSCDLHAAITTGSYKKAISNVFSYVSIGVCRHGYYAGFEANGNKNSLQNCMAACEAERRCKYFSFAQGHTCSRFDTDNCAQNSEPSHATYERVLVPPACCENGDFVHTSDACSSGDVYMKSTPHVWLPRGNKEVRLTPKPAGTGEVRWDCGRRRSGHERTGFSPPATNARIHYDGNRIDFYPKYCAPPMPRVRESPRDRGCCSIADGTVDRCSSANFIQIKVGDTEDTWKKCYKNQICEWEFPTPQTQGQALTWYCGNTEEKVRWGLYFDTLQIKFHCDGKVEWNPWWCGLATGSKAPPSVVTQFAGVVGVSTAGDLINGKDSQPLSVQEMNTKADNFVYQNRKAICEGMSAAAVYDQLLKPSSVCWRAGMTARSSLFPHQSDYGSKTSLAEEGTQFERGERESSPFVAFVEQLRSNATLLQLAASGNASEQDLYDPFQIYCQASGGTDCSKIGKERCTCYCVDPGTCTTVMAGKYAKAAAAIIEMALDIVSVVFSGGTSVVAKAGAKAAAKASLKAAARKAKTGGKSLMTKAASDSAKTYVKTSAKQSMKGRLKRQVAKDFSDDWATKTTKQKFKETVKEKVNDAIETALTRAACQQYIEDVFGDVITDPDWVSSPDFRWGDGQSVTGFLEVIDITGVVGLVGIFHEADCPAPVPGALNGESCPR